MPVLPLVFLEFSWRHLPESVAHRADGPPVTAHCHPLLSGARPGHPGQLLIRPSRRWRPILSLTHLAILEMPNKIVNNLVIKAAQASRSGPMCPPVSRRCQPAPCL